jgi:hypothetical protein
MTMRSGRWRLQWLAAGLLAALIVAAVGLAQTAGGKSVLRKAGLVDKPARYTELSFAHPQLLPEKFPDGRFKIHAPFIVHNNEGRGYTYHWVVLEIDGRTTKRVASGASHGAEGETFPVNPTMKLECTHAGRVHVSVQVQRPARSIGWWADCLPKKLPGQVHTQPHTRRHG